MIFSSRRFLQKRNKKNSTLLLDNLFLFVFWKKVKTPIRHFEIIWPLVCQDFSSEIILLHSVWLVGPPCLYWHWHTTTFSENCLTNTRSSSSFFTGLASKQRTFITLSVITLYKLYKNSKIEFSFKSKTHFIWLDVMFNKNNGLLTF